MSKNKSKPRKPRSKSKGKGEKAPKELNTLNTDTIDVGSHISYDIESDVSIEVLDLAVHLRSAPVDIRRNTKVIKRGKKVRK